MTKSRQAGIALLAVTAIWGSTFFIIKDALNHIDPLDYLAIRFTIAAILPAAIFWQQLKRLTRRAWLSALMLGGLYGLAQVAQTIGLQHTSASVSGFITGTYVILTPLLLWLLFRMKPSRATWIAVVLAMVGLAVLSLNGTGNGSFGEALTLLGAALYALHIIVLDRQARHIDATALTVGQLIGVAITCVILAAPDGIPIPSGGNVWGAILYTAIVAGVVTMLLQTWSQRHLSPTRVALLMTFEPVFASIFAILFGGESMTLRLAIGGGLIFLATYMGIRGGRSTPRSERQRFKALLRSLRDRATQVVELKGSDSEQ